VGLLMETELWFNLIRACRSKGVPLLLVNARMSLKSARGYARLGRLAGDALRQLTAIAAQSGTDAVRLRELGAPQVTVTGNIKFDVTPPADALSQGQALRQLSGVSRPVFLAASTREGEESLVLDAMARAAVPGLLTVIVPRHPQRFDEVAVLLRERGVCYSRRSRITVVSPECTVLLGDSMGEMPAYYAACDVAFVGGSLLPYGGQNLIEACTLGKPVLIGPYTFNFEQAAAEAVAQGAAVRVRDVTGLATELGALMCDVSARRRMGEAGLAFAASNRGAAQRTLQLVSAALEKPAA
jgi:3-deoxy-D-manno-octulosonic-acid transferase